MHTFLQGLQEQGVQKTQVDQASEPENEQVNSASVKNSNSSDLFTTESCCSTLEKSSRGEC